MQVQKPFWRLEIGFLNLFLNFDQFLCSIRAKSIPDLCLSGLKGLIKTIYILFFVSGYCDISGDHVDNSSRHYLHLCRLCRILLRPKVRVCTVIFPRIRIRDPVPFWPLDPGSGIGFSRIPDLGSRIPNPYFWEHSDNFLSERFYNSLKIGPKVFLKYFKN